jgi:cell wall-associated NlpC family hydrolase
MALGARLALALVAAALALLAPGTASPRSDAVPRFAAKEVAAVIDAGLMGPSTATFRPQDPLTAGELAAALWGLGGDFSHADPSAHVTVRELHAQLVTLAGLRSEARAIRVTAAAAGLAPRPWLGTETVARLLGLRVNHPDGQDDLELQVNQAVTRAEAAYSMAVYLRLDEPTLESVRRTAASFSLPQLTAWQQLVLTRAFRFVGSPYVWAGTSERPQQLAAGLLPGGFDCSGFVWRVYRTQPFAEAPELARVLVGRTTYEMSGEVPRGARVTRAGLRPGDVVFFGSRGPRSKPGEVDHMGIYAGNGWIVHSSRFGTTLTPMTGWYETRFAWGRRPLVEAGLES